MMDDDSRILYSENYSHKAFTVSSVIFLTRGAVSTNQRPVFRSRDLSRPIRGQGGATLLLWVLKQSQHVTRDFLNDPKCDEINAKSVTDL